MKKLFIILSLALLTSAAHAQANRTAADARRVFDEMRAKYATLETYSHRINHKELNGKVQPDKVEFSFRQPNRFASKSKIPNGMRTSISNGRTNYFYDSRQSKTNYFAFPMPPQKLGRIGLMQDAPAGPILSPLLAGVDPFGASGREAQQTFSWGK